MPIRYLYRCASCENEFEEYQSIKDNPLIVCSLCHLPELYRVIHAANSFVRGEAKTVAQLAERNTASLGRYGREAFWEKQRVEKQEAKEMAKRELQKKLPPGATAV
jgi:putative FmdB family regulatory protein